MPETRAQLLARKADLYTALRVLESDREDGLVDVDAYRRSRDRFEREAASVLQRIEQWGNGRGSAVDAAPTRTPLRLVWPILAAMIVAVTGLVGLLLSSSHPRTAGDSITGAQPSNRIITPNPVSAALVAARARLRRSPGSADAYLNLGNVYLSAGQIPAAERSYHHAAILAPDRPEGLTLDALVLATLNQPDRALAQLRQVEAAHPHYARAWLTDGLIASRRPPGIPRAIAAWQRFLSLQPRGNVANDVRISLTALRRAAAHR